VKPGDLVQIVDHGAYYSFQESKIGLLIAGFDAPSSLATPIQVLVDGEIRGFDYYELRLVNQEGTGYDNTKEDT
jgi:hypothetical protein